MQPPFKTPSCPACQHNNVVEHIELAPAEDRIKGVDRRCVDDLTFLSLIEVDRRKSKTDRRGIDCSGLVVEHQQVRNMVCLACAHGWHAEGSIASVMQ